MNEQYFAQNPTSESRPVSCVFSYRGCELRFLTDSGVFSRGEVDYIIRNENEVEIEPLRWQ